MKIPALSGFLLLLLLKTSFAQTNLDGILINISPPNGWQVVNQQFGFVMLTHSEKNGFIAISEHPFVDSNTLIEKLQENLSDQNFELTLDGSVVSLNNVAKMVKYNGWMQGESVKVVATATTNQKWNGGLYIVAIASANEYDLSYELAIRHLTNTVKYRDFALSESRELKAILTGKSIKNFNYYSTSSSNDVKLASAGSSKITTISLCGNGSFHQNTSSQIAAGSNDFSSTDASSMTLSGKWSPLKIKQRLVIRFRPDDDDIRYFIVEDYDDSGALYINGEKWVIDGNSHCQ